MKNFENYTDYEEMMDAICDNAGRAPKKSGLHKAAKKKGGYHKKQMSPEARMAYDARLASERSQAAARERISRLKKDED